MKILYKEQEKITTKLNKNEYKGISKNSIFIERWPSFSVFDAQNKPIQQRANQGAIEIPKRTAILPIEYLN